MKKKMFIVGAIFVISIYAMVPLFSQDNTNIAAQEKSTVVIDKSDVSPSEISEETLKSIGLSISVIRPDFPAPEK